MPFSESGISPDVIINPNAFPSRMTIGMLLEQIIAKGKCFSGDKKQFGCFEPCDYSDYQKILQANGFKKTGTERLYSGVNGELMEADIY